MDKIFATRFERLEDALEAVVKYKREKPGALSTIWLLIYIRYISYGD